MAAGVGAGRAQSVSMSFRPKAKSSAMPVGLRPRFPGYPSAFSSRTISPSACRAATPPAPRPSEQGGPADDDEFPLLEKPLSSSESKKLGQLLDQVGRLKDEALKAREASASKAEEAAASDRV